ncbi:hypothetical protein WJX72_011719 [[Myrmecia] bisecta]|uniref:Uncharacterized protein n=1 Tax=[Myrmecia] bisecta TaxID=41462 RepID=A0AAW1RAU6_9CHLO
MEVFVDYGSQPSRMVMLFCRVNKLPVKEHIVQISRGQNRTKEQLAVNPLGKLPYLKHGDFVLPESAAICRYLAATHQVPDHWYPADPRQRARVDAALDWHHGNVRAGAAKLTWHRVIAPVLGAGQYSETVAREAENTLKTALKSLETYWLASTPFVAGQQISLPDLLMACELQQLVLLDGAKQGATMQQLMEPLPAVRAWMDCVAAAIGPQYAVVHQILGKMRERAVSLKQQQPASKM